MVNEKFCRKCGMPFQEGPMPKAIDRFQEGNIGAEVYPAGNFRQREVVVQFGRWKAVSGKFYLSELVPIDEIADLLAVVQQVQQVLTSPRKTRAARQ
jgi:hypothetical protein